MTLIAEHIAHRLVDIDNRQVSIGNHQTFSCRIKHRGRQLQLGFGKPAFCMIYREGYAAVIRTLEYCRADQDRDPVPVLVKKLFFERLAVTCPGDFREGLVVPFPPFGRCDAAPVESSLDNILPAVPKHFQKIVIGIVHMTIAMPVDNAQDVVFEKTAETVFTDSQFFFRLADLGNGPAREKYDGNR